MPWEISYSEEFKAGVQKHCRKNKQLEAELNKRMKKIAADPLLGDTKTGRYKACRSDHVSDHWVVGWYMEPPVLMRAHLPQVKKVVFFFFGHHDEWD